MSLQLADCIVVLAISACLACRYVPTVLLVQRDTSSAFSTKEKLSK